MNKIIFFENNADINLENYFEILLEKFIKMIFDDIFLLKYLCFIEENREALFVKFKYEFNEKEMGDIKKITSPSLLSYNAHFRTLREENENLSKKLSDYPILTEINNSNMEDFINKSSRERYLEHVKDDIQIASEEALKLFFSDNDYSFAIPAILLKGSNLIFSILKNDINDSKNVIYKSERIVFSEDIKNRILLLEKNKQRIENEQLEHHRKKIREFIDKTENDNVKNKVIPYILKNINSELNEKQFLAATYDNENLLILAGAGCGKTKTIIARAAYLISQGYSPNRIKILTFTKKASSEITQRVYNILSGDCYGLEASTFHRWCIDLIKNTPEIFGYTGFTVIDRDDQLQIFKKIRGKPKKGELPKPSELCDTYSFARNTRLSLSKAIIHKIPVFQEKKDEIAHLMQGYETEKNTLNYLDYDDILDIIATAVTQNDDVCKWIARKYDCILVDEMQDTNPLQWAILEPLSHYTKLFCVGDDAQSIYGFRGTDFKNIHSFNQRIKNSTILRLEDNYRSTQEILDLSNWLLSKSFLNYNKNLKAIRGKGKIPELHTFLNNYEESRWIISNLKSKYEVDGIWKNKMVLIRSGYSGRNIETELLRNKIPYIFIGGQKLLEAAHIKDLMSILRVISNNKDEIAWMRFLTLFPGIGSITAERFSERLIKENSIENCLDILKTASYAGTTLDILFQRLSLIKNNIPELIGTSLNFMNDLLLEKYGKIEWDYRKKDFDFLKQLAMQFKSIDEFMEEYLLDPVFISQEDKQKSENCMILSTIHSAKGTEKDIVYVANVSIGKCPSLRDLNSYSDREEERRVLYVALTRAKNELIITRNVELDSWLYEDDINILKNNYFLRNLPLKLVKAFVHHENTYLQSGTNLQKRYYGEAKSKSSDLKNKLISNSNIQSSKNSESKTKKSNLLKKEINKSPIQPADSNSGLDKTSSKNIEIVNFMKNHKKGELYSEEIKIAIAEEYIPNINTIETIGKKYGINSDVIRPWISKYRGTLK